MEYNFNANKCIDDIENQWKSWAERIGISRFILGISGGKDSTVVAALAAKIFGSKNVFGVMMPNGEQKDIEDSNRVIETLGINGRFVNIKQSYDDIVSRAQTSGNSCEPLNSVAKINLAPRIRMAVLYAIGQNIGAAVLNTDNLSERILGWSTLWGDSVGSYAPIQNLTVSEVVSIGDALGIPFDLVHKVPSDGLTNKSDEDNIGFKYKDLDLLIRTNTAGSDLRTLVFDRYNKNKFKMEMIHLSGPIFDFPNHVVG